MSSRNTHLIDRIYEAFETRDFLTFFGLLSPAIHTRANGYVSSDVKSKTVSLAASDGA